MTIEETVWQVRRLYADAQLKRKYANELREKARAFDLEAEAMYGEANKLVGGLFEDEK